MDERYESGMRARRDAHVDRAVAGTDSTEVYAGVPSADSAFRIAQRALDGDG